MMDEHLHYRQIQSFLHGDWTIDWELPMVAGYHFVLASIGKILQFDKIPFYEAVAYFRTISFIFALLTIPVFYLIAASVNKSSAMIKTLQFSFFPLIFPYFPLLYTDLFSLLLVLLAVLAFYRKYYFFSAVMFGASVLVRQNNLFWAMFFNALIYLEDYGPKVNLKNISKHVRKTIVFIIPLLVFLTYLLFNRRLAHGDGTLVFATISWSNIFLINFYFVVLFVPLILNRLKDIFKFFWKYKLYFLPVVAAFPLFSMLITNTHPVNYNFGTFFIHNNIANFFINTFVNKIYLYIIAVFSMTTLFIFKLEDKKYYLLYPFTIAFLLPLWMIEGRYYIIPLVLFLLFRKSLDSWLEYLLLMWFVLISLYFYWGIFNWKFFM